jgi:hypothetical protein
MFTSGNPFFWRKNRKKPDGLVNESEMAELELLSVLQQVRSLGCCLAVGSE